MDLQSSLVFLDKTLHLVSNKENFTEVAAHTAENEPIRSIYLIIRGTFGPIEVSFLVEQGHDVFSDLSDAGIRPNIYNRFSYHCCGFFVNADI